APGAVQPTTPGLGPGAEYPESKAAGGVQPPGNLPTGPTTPRRSVCAPAAVALSSYRRPVPERMSIMGFSSWLLKQTRSAPSAHRRTQGSTRHRAAFRPRLEALEARCLPSTFQVTNLADSGLHSLRQAILDANANPGADVIGFSGAARSGTIVLTSGQLSIT